MKILFLGFVYDSIQEKTMLKYIRKSGLQNAANIYQWNIINGLDVMNENPIDVYNTIPVGIFPKYYKKLFIKSYCWIHKKGSSDRHIGFINLFLLKQYIRTKNYYRNIKKWIENNKQTKQKAIIVYSLYTPFLKAIRKVKRKYNVHICTIVTDLPNQYGFEVSTNKIKKYIYQIDGKIKMKLKNVIDSFVLVTDKMRIPLQTENKPYITIEGSVDYEVNSKKNYINLDSTNTDKKIILYSGTLHHQFGIKSLLEAFRKIEKDNYELWICGSGDVENEIQELSYIDSRIKFYGYISNEDVKKLQSQATILVNPRPNHGEYIKYSFPSKTLEYMLTGKPIIMFKLDGIPDEYDEYLLYFDDMNSENMKNKIIEVCEKSEQERMAIGMKAREFVLNNKNNYIQASKIIELIKGALYEDSPN